MGSPKRGLKSHLVNCVPSTMCTPITSVHFSLVQHKWSYNSFKCVKMFRPVMYTIFLVFFVSIVFQLHKWKCLERHPILLLAKRGTNDFAADCLCPWQIETEDGENALLTIKRIYESLLNGKV